MCGLLALFAPTLVRNSNQKATRSSDTIELANFAAGEFDCDADLAGWKTGWSDSKKTWCCQHVQKGCTAESQASQPSNRLWLTQIKKEGDSEFIRHAFDCSEGHGNWLSGWSNRKKFYCCAQGLDDVCQGFTDVQKAGMQKPGITFDCEAGLSNSDKGWSTNKKTWCCHNQAKGCPSGVEPFDCAAGLANSKIGWSNGKKNWCCVKYKKGCLHHETKPFDCSKDLSQWQSVWKRAKKEWCCEKEGKGCPSEYDCVTDRVYAHRSWSKERREWCCINQQAGCPSSDATYQCQDGVANAVHGWSSSKRHWCCSHYKKGCKYLTIYASPNVGELGIQFEDFNKVKSATEGLFAAIKGVEAGYILDQVGTNKSFIHVDSVDGLTPESFNTDLQRRPISLRFIIPAEAAGSSMPYDCKAGLGDWTPSKKAWCCLHENTGCSASQNQTVYDCAAGFFNWRDGWSKAKKAFCCVHAAKACPTKFACLRSDQEQWSGEERTYCCQAMGYGCKSTTGLPHDCKTGFDMWETSWTAEQKAWCCNSFGRGCQPATTGAAEISTSSSGGAQFDCAAGYSNWQKGWSPAKKQFCCARMGKGCPPTSPPFDCNAGFFNWANGWSVPKKKYCCKNVGKGCAAMAIASVR